ncbi:PRC-barrel domain-containing protein [Kosmotoga sp.]|uniref:PRC-barrel domain-containing protein n=1 Tax=Kosmotoga sp. TaxID=1955248 RepID=UPI0024AB2B29|nr:PRC-barrel domain-containing protein [Kosmotoga sp.]MDI3524345.1 hypothetical protein [Kosmotoga sp.]
METRLRWGAKVISSDGKNLGRPTRVVVHPVNNEVTHIVIEKGMFNRKAKLVPINSIYFAAPDEIRLRVKASEVEKLQDFEEIYFITGEGAEGRVTPVYWLRPVGDYAELYPLPSFSVSSNISEDSTAIEPGALIITAEDKEAGRVRSILLDETGHITHLVIEISSQGKKKEKLLPIDWVTEIEQSSVKVSASYIMLEKLPDKDE